MKKEDQSVKAARICEKKEDGNHLYIWINGYGYSECLCKYYKTSSFYGY